MKIRNYHPSDYSAIKQLLLAADTFGGVFDEARDSAERLAGLEEKKPGSILVAESEGVIVGTVTLFEDGRAAWLYRFAVQSTNEQEIAAALQDHAARIMKDRGHTQILVYAPVGDQHFENRYINLGFTKGNDFTAYWQEI